MCCRGEQHPRQRHAPGDYHEPATPPAASFAGQKAIDEPRDVRYYPEDQKDRTRHKDWALKRDGQPVNQVDLSCGCPRPRSPRKAHKDNTQVVPQCTTQLPVEQQYGEQGERRVRERRLFCEYGSPEEHTGEEGEH